MKIKNKLVPAIVAGAGITIAGISLTTASSHREAPAIAEDQYVDNTDVYAFISPQDSNRLVMVANYVPLLIPASGPNFYKFSDTAFYEIGVDNDGDAIDDITYRWTFDNQTKNGNTFLYNVGPVDSLKSPNLNVTQTYTLTRIDHANGNRKKTLFRDAPVAP